MIIQQLENKMKINMHFVTIIGLWSLLIGSNCQQVLFNCEFGDGNDCNFVRDDEVPALWILNSGPTDSRNTGPEGDHSSDGKGYYMYAESTNFAEGDIARIYSSKISGTANACTTIKFYVYTYGADVGTLNLYVLGDAPYYFVSPLAQRKETSSEEWIEMTKTLRVSFDYSIAFEAIFRGSLLTDNKGDIAIDDITITTDTNCGTSSCDGPETVCLNNGTCVATITTEEGNFMCECASGYSGIHCENDADECSSDPCQNGICSHGLDSFSCTCYIGYYGVTCEYVDMCVSGELDRCQNGGTCNRVEDDFSCTCAPGFTGRVCEVNINDCDPNPCRNDGFCTDGDNDYQCACPTDFYGKNCQYLAGECDFDEGNLDSCGYVSESTYLDWIVNQGKTPIPSVGPDQDHTTGNGFYVYADVDQFEENVERATARLVTPKFPDASLDSCTTITFWYFMTGSDMGTLNIFVRSELNAQEEPIFSLTGDQGARWNQGTVSISSSVPYYVVFDSVSKRGLIAVQNNYIGLDDILVKLNDCDFDYCSEAPCKNGGICFSDATQYVCECIGTWTGKQCTEDRNECTEPTPACKNGGSCTDKNPGFECTCTDDYVGSICEYVKGSCDFDDPKSPICGYQNVETTPGFTWTRYKGETPSSLTGPVADHTFGNADGYYLYVEATEVEEFSSARIVTPVVTDSGSTCTGLDFWYHMRGRDIGELALYLQFGDESPTTPIWNMIGEQGDDWKLAGLNISVKNDFKMIFEATVKAQSLIEPDNRGDIAIDDIVVRFDRVCGYDMCFTKPCENGATCVSINENEYRCDCQEGYGGKNCENTNDCTPETCLNEGYCFLNSEGQTECLCNEGWVGDECEIKDPCLPNPCQNNGTCSRYQDTTFQCTCIPGFTGSTCQIDIDECESSPCKNGGDCLDLIDAFECECQGNYIGTTCREIPGGCDFENGFCDWFAPTPDFDWTRYSGPGPNFPTSGPRSDHTYGNSSGYYLFTEVYRDEPPAGTQYQLQSSVISKAAVEDGKILTLEFYYHMYGPGIGTLNVYILNDGGLPQILKSIPKGEDRLDWIRFAEQVEPQNDFSIMIEHMTGRDLLYLADLAVDDIALLISDGITIGGTTAANQNATCFNCNDNPNSVGLSGGAIAGIVIGVVAALLLVAIGGVWFYREKRYSRFGRPTPMEIQVISTMDDSMS